MEVFDKFCEGLISTISSIWENLPKKITSLSTKKTRFRSLFHERRLDALPKLWYELFKKLQLVPDDLFLQSVSQELFQQLLTIEITKEMPTREQEPIILTPDELNAMQYACGYVPYKLLKKYEKKDYKQNVLSNVWGIWQFNMRMIKSPIY